MCQRDNHSNQLLPVCWSVGLVGQFNPSLETGWRRKAVSSLARGGRNVHFKFRPRRRRTVDHDWKRSSHIHPHYQRRCWKYSKQTRRISKCSKVAQSTLKKNEEKQTANNHAATRIANQVVSALRTFGEPDRPERLEVSSTRLRPRQENFCPVAKSKCCGLRVISPTRALKRLLQPPLKHPREPRQKLQA